MTTDLSFLKNWEPDLINSREWLNQYTVGIANNRLIRFDQEQLDKSSKEREALSQWKDRATKIMQLRKDTFQYENIPIISAAQHTYDDEYSTEYENAEPFYQNILMDQNISSEDELNLKPLLKEELKVFVLDQHVNGRLLTNISFSPRMHLFDLRNFTTDEEGAKLLMIAIQKVHAIEKLYLTNFIKTKTFDEEGQYFNSFVDNIPASVWKNIDTLYIDGHSLFFCVENITGKMKNSNVQRLETIALSTEQFKFFADLPKLHTWVISSTRADLNELVKEVLKPNWPKVNVNAFFKWFKPEEISSWNDTSTIPQSDPSAPHTSLGDRLIVQSTCEESRNQTTVDHLKLFYANEFLDKPGLSDKLLGIKVALLDTGVDYLHKDLNHAIIKGKTCIPDENWFVDSNGHGTHCAGIIAGKDSGLAPGVQLYIAKVLNSRGEGDVAWLEDGLKWAIEQKVNIISLSLSSKKHNNRIYQLIMKAIGEGVLVICAAGNAGGWNRFNITFPATIDSCIRVASVNSFGRISEYSSVGGPQIDVAALGEGVRSTWPGNRYRKKDGTSMAAPMISGLCALLLAYDKVCHEDDPKLLNAHCMKDLFRNLAFNVTQEIGKGGGILQLENILEIPELFKKYLRDVV